MRFMKAVKQHKIKVYPSSEQLPKANQLAWKMASVATDPVAVVAILNSLGASPRLTMLISGESLLNDGTAIVIFNLFYAMSLGLNRQARYR